MPQITLHSGERFDAPTGGSILDAAAAAGLALAYSCRTGRCSTCRCRVLSGDTRTLVSETGLSAQELADGWILSCARTATSDLLLDAEALAGQALPRPLTLPCRIACLETLAPDVLRIQLRLPPGNSLDFLPGQYLSLIGTSGMRRSYSLASRPTVGEPLELHVRAVDGGAMSDYWFHQARIGDLLRLHGPLGTFFLRDVAGCDLILLATGTGIAPIKAMLEALPSMAAETAPRSVTVLWGGRVATDLYLDIESLPGDHRYIPVLSRAGGGWSGARGHVQDVLIAHRPNLCNAAVYACGSDAMIHGARVALLQVGLPARRFHSDAFVCSAPTIDEGR